MRLEVLRYNDTLDETLGLLMVNGKFRAHTLEDEERTVKVWGETRIPEGTYKIGFRTVGGFHAKYSERFPHFHKGMLQVLDVPGFDFILLHIGNKDEDTAGCLLIAESLGYDNKSIVRSAFKYKEIYKEVADSLSCGEPVTITYRKIYEHGND